MALTGLDSDQCNVVDSDEGGGRGEDETRGAENNSHTMNGGVYITSGKNRMISLVKPNLQPSRPVLIKNKGIQAY